MSLTVAKCTPGGFTVRWELPEEDNGSPIKTYRCNANALSCAAQPVCRSFKKLALGLLIFCVTCPRPIVCFACPQPAETLSVAALHYHSVCRAAVETCMAEVLGSLLLHNLHLACAVQMYCCAGLCAVPFA